MVNTDALTPEQMIAALGRNIADLAQAQEAQARNLQNLSKIISKNFVPVNAFVRKQDDREIKRDRRAKEPSEVVFSKKSIKELKRLDISEKMDALLKEARKQPKSNESFFSKILGPIGLILSAVAATGLLAGKFPGVRQLLQNFKTGNIGQAITGFLSKFNKSDKSLTEWIRSIPIVGKLVDLYEGFQLIGQGNFKDGLKKLVFAIPGAEFLSELWDKTKTKFRGAFKLDDKTPLNVNTFLGGITKFISDIWTSIKQSVIGFFNEKDGIWSTIKKTVIDPLFKNNKILQTIKDKLNKTIQDIDLSSIINNALQPISGIFNGINFQDKINGFISNLIQPLVSNLIGPDTAMGFILARIKELFSGDVTKARILDFLHKLSARFPSIANLTNIVEQLFSLNFDTIVTKAIDAVMKNIGNFDLSKELDNLIADLGKNVGANLSIGDKVKEVVGGIKDKIKGIYTKINGLLANVVDIFGAIANMLSDDPARYAQGKAFLEKNAPGLANLFDTVLNVVHAINDVVGGADINETMKKYGFDKINFSSILETLGANIMKFFEKDGKLDKWVTGLIDKQMDKVIVLMDKKADELGQWLADNAVDVGKKLFKALLDAIWEKAKEKLLNLKDKIYSKLGWGTDDNKMKSTGVTAGLDEDKLENKPEQPVYANDINKTWLESQFNKIVDNLCACIGKEKTIIREVIRKPEIKESADTENVSTSTKIPSKPVNTASVPPVKPEQPKKPISEAVANTNVTAKNDKAADMYLEAYNTFKRADELVKSQDKKDKEQAYNDYKAALNKIIAVETAYPDFEKDMVRGRERMLINQIAKLEQELNNIPANTLSRPKVTATTAAATATNNISEIQPAVKPALNNTPSNTAPTANNTANNKEMIDVLKRIDAAMQKNNQINTAIAQKDTTPANTNIVNVNNAPKTINLSGQTGTKDYRHDVMRSAFAYA
jgi:hypothetical protein